MERKASGQPGLVAEDAFGETASWRRTEVVDGRVSLVRSLYTSAARKDLEIRLEG